jgi:hypothetical protein
MLGSSCSSADVSRIRDEDGDDPEVKKLRAGLSSQFELDLSYSPSQ